MFQYIIDQKRTLSSILLKNIFFFVLEYKKETFYGFIALYSIKNRTLLTFLAFLYKYSWGITKEKKMTNKEIYNNLVALVESMKMSLCEPV